MPRRGRKASSPPTQARLHELFDYDPATGLFTHKVSRSGVKKGDIVGTKVSRSNLGLSVDGKMWPIASIVWLYARGEWQRHLTRRDGDLGNNRIGNLVASTRSQASAHARRSANNKTGFKGVSFCRTRALYRASIMVDGRFIHLGYFYTKRSAHRAYVSAAVEHFGAFARAS